MASMQNQTLAEIAPGVNDLADAMLRAIDAASFSINLDSINSEFRVGETKEMRDVVGLVRMAAENELNVTIYGENNTGKQLVAKAIHSLSGRTGPFQYLNSRDADCNAQENALQEAKGGTLYLDSIQHLAMPLQKQLLKVAADGRLGRSNDYNVRLIVSTNHSLNDLVADEVLPANLAQDLAVLLITLPPLRQRQGDFPTLFEHLVNLANKTLNKHVQVTLRPETLEKLRGHNWPGNIRELETTIMRAVAITEANIILPDDIQLDERGWLSPVLEDSQDSEAVPNPVMVLTDQLERLDKDQRYQFLLDQKDMGLRASVLIEFICRLRQQTGERVSHAVLAGAIHQLNRATDYDTVRQFVCTALKHKGLTLTKLECNF